MPTAFQPVVPPAAPRSRSRTLAITAIVAIVLIAIVGGGGIFANASLSSTYSPQRAVVDYLAAQGRGDVNFMMANAVFQKGGTANDQYFDKGGLTAMMNLPENKAITGVSVQSTEQIDSSTSKVTVSMSWNGSQRTQTYAVHKDTARQHYLFYNSWLVDVPYSTVNITLPNQGGAVTVDGFTVPAGQSSVEVVQGYHAVSMAPTDLYDKADISANAVDGDASVAFPSKLSAAAQAAAVDSIKAAFQNVTCDANKYFDCPGHAYTVPAGYYEMLPAPGGDIRANSKWNIAFTGDPTANMTLTVTATADKVTASGKCAMTLTVDGSHTYQFTGDWTGDLTWASSGFNSNVTENCDSARA